LSGILPLALLLAAPPTPAAAEPVPFDLAYVPACAKGVYGIRPHLLFARPGMNTFLDTLKAQFKGALVSFQSGYAGDFPFDDIEQVVGMVMLKEGAGKPGDRSMMLSVTMIRMRHDFDWAGTFKAGIPGLIEAEHGGKKYYRLPGEFFAMLGNLSVYAPDARTVVFMSEPEIHGLIDGPAKPARDWGADWRRVERSAAAVCYDNADRHLTKVLAPEVQSIEGLAELTDLASTLTVGIDLGDAMTARAFARADDTNTARVAHGCAKLLDRARSTAAGAAKAAGKDKPAWVRLVEDLAGGAAPVRDGGAVRYEATTGVGVADLIGAALKP
jgi:hypothetical protein